MSETTQCYECGKEIQLEAAYVRKYPGCEGKVSLHFCTECWGDNVY